MLDTEETLVIHYGEEYPVHQLVLQKICARCVHGSIITNGSAVNCQAGLNNNTTPAVDGCPLPVNHIEG